MCKLYYYSPTLSYSRACCTFTVMKNFSAQTIVEVTPKFESENAQISIGSWISASPMSVLAGSRQLENRQNAMNETPSA